MGIILLFRKNALDNLMHYVSVTIPNFGDIECFLYEHKSEVGPGAHAIT